jgi:hypothetical protein
MAAQRVALGDWPGAYRFERAENLEFPQFTASVKARAEQITVMEND